MAQHITNITDEPQDNDYTNCVNQTMMYNFEVIGRVVICMIFFLILNIDSQLINYIHMVLNQPGLTGIRVMTTDA